VLKKRSSFLSSRQGGCFLENGAEPFSVEAQMKSVFLGELRDFYFAVALVWRQMRCNSLS
jgi:hypothetical protein